MNIIPGITAYSKKEFRKQIKAISWAKKVHFDVMDGQFVRQKTAFGSVKNAQVHLMVKDASRNLKGSEVVIHAESKSPLKALLLAKKRGIEAGIAFNPSTKVNKVLVSTADFALVMTVKPGASGQKMKKASLKKIRQIKAVKRIPVGVDGGVNSSTILSAKKAGADFVIATSAVTLAQHPKNAFAALKRILK